MNNLIKYCSDLLITQNCVILPDFGAFIVRQTPAHYSKSESKFFPPRREIAFNSSIKKDDGLLAHIYSQASGKNFNTSQKELSESILNVKKQLQEGKIVFFGNIGSFRQLSSNEVVFTPSPIPVPSPEFYGLYSFPATMLSTAKAAKAISQSIEKHSSGILKYAAGIALLLSLSLIPSQITHQSLVQQQRAYFSFPQNNISYQANTHDSISRLIDSITLKKNALALHTESIEKTQTESPKDSVIEVKPVVIDEPVVTKENKSTTVTNPESGYFVIAGSFVEMWRAEKFINEVKSKGFETQIVHSDNKIRVSVGYAEIKKDAEKQLSEIRKSNPDMQFWVLSIK